MLHMHFFHQKWQGWSSTSLCNLAVETSQKESCYQLSSYPLREDMRLIQKRKLSSEIVQAFQGGFELLGWIIVFEGSIKQAAKRLGHRCQGTSPLQPLPVHGLQASVQRATPQATFTATKEAPGVFQQGTAVGQRGQLIWFRKIWNTNLAGLQGFPWEKFNS